MSSFFQKARERAAEAAAQFHQQHGQDGVAEEGESSKRRSSNFSYAGSIPHMLRHGVASVDPRHDYNRSFHQLAGKLKALRIDYDGLARENRNVAIATCRWGQDQLPEKREDGAGDEALADMADRLAYIFSLMADLQSDHAKRLEDSRADLKRIQKAEAELAPKRAARVKIHKELVTLIPERAKVNSTKIAPLETQLENLEADDKVLEEELGRLKREALKSSYDAHFDSVIELGEKMALLARYGKLINTILPVYAPPFPTPRHISRSPGDETWPGESKIAAIRAAVQPALDSFKPDYSIPAMPSTAPSNLSKRQTVRYGEEHKQELEKALREEEDGGIGDSQDSTLIEAQLSPTTLPMGGSLPPNLNLEPTPMPMTNPKQRSSIGAVSPGLTPRNAQNFDTPTLQSFEGYGVNSVSSQVADLGPTLAETGSPVQSSSDGPGPLTGTLSPRIRNSSAAATSSSFAARQAQFPRDHIAARLRSDGTVVRRGDPDWHKAEEEDLPPYHE